MHICPHGANPAQDIACTCDPRPEAGLENPIDRHLGGSDAGLPPPTMPLASASDLSPSPAPPLSSANGQAPMPAPASMAPAPVPKRAHVVAFAVVLVAVGVGVMMGRASVPSPAPASAAPAGARQGAGAELRPQPPTHGATPSVPPKWIRTQRAGWASDGSRVVGFELHAENEVRVWMKHVRPALAVRCVGRQVEAFVITDSAMSIESSPDQHTVRVSFDGESQREERWLDSESKRELFAPDGAALADRLALARTMRFGFTPYSATPVVVDFDVHGFTGPLEALTRACRLPSKAKAGKGRT